MESTDKSAVWFFGLLFALIAILGIAVAKPWFPDPVEPAKCECASPKKHGSKER